ncbi:MAG: hypothetical protein RL033_7290 [Pseudomonadota bacterium]|jgi:putative ABC transport system permease protein
MSIPFAYSSRSLWVRRKTSIATMGGIALVVFVLAASLMLVRGVRQALVSSGSPDNAIVFQQAASSEVVSSLRQGVFGLVAAAPGIQSSAAGGVLASAESVQVISARAIGDSRIANVQVRGVSANVLELRPEVRLMSGRALAPGTNEAMIGSALVGRYEGLTLGSELELDKGHPTRIVGVFSAQGAAFESEVWADLHLVQTATNTDEAISSVTVRLTSPAAFDDFASALEAGQRQEGLRVERERSYYEALSRGLSAMILALGGLVTLILSLGAVLGAAITMYASVEQRVTEIAVLRALGFSQTQVLVAFVTEAACLSLAGTAFGLALASFTGLVHFTVANTAAASAEVTFRFVPSAVIWLGSALAGALIGVIGGAFPALRAARLDPVRALRA